MLTSNTTGATTTATAQFLCSTCHISFQHQHDRREHMRTNWHVYNLKRKMAELPPISSRVYDTIVQPAETETIAAEYTPSGNDVEDSSSEDGSEQDETVTTTDCLFCLTRLSSIEDNLDHMSACHGFIIPDLEHLETDIETFLAYLGLVISQFHACLYCGHEKHSAEAARSHMLAKGHCMLDLSSDSEFLDFWASEDDEKLDATQRLSDQELCLLSGAVLFSKDAKQSRIRPGRRKLQKTGSRRRLEGYERKDETSEAETTGDDAKAKDSSTPQEVARVSRSEEEERQMPSSSSRALARRDQMGVTGLSESQIRTLISAERKAMSIEFRSRDRAQWTRDRLGNKTKQKYFKACTICRSGLFIDPVRR